MKQSEIWDMELVVNATKPSTSTSATKSKVPRIKKKKTLGRSAKLKSSKWYQGAARAIGITK